MSNLPRLAANILSTIFAVTCAVLGIVALSEGSFLGAFSLGMAAALSFPRSRAHFIESVAKPISGAHIFSTILIFTVIGLIATAISGSENKTERDAASQVAAETAKKQEAITAQSLRNQEFIRNKNSILSTAASNISNRRFVEATEALNAYTEVDPDLSALKNQAEVGSIKVKLSAGTALALSERVTLLTRLVELEPSNSVAVKQQGELSAELKKQEAVAAAKAARAAELHAQFSPWSGAHRNVEKEVKNQMHNPDSYEHVSTRYIDGPNYLTVITKFRGTNGFGGIVTSTAIAKVAPNGEVESLETIR